MMTDKIRKKVIFHKKCPLFGTKCKRNECVFYRDGAFLDNTEHIDKKVIRQRRISGRVETEYSAKGVKGFLNGLCDFRGSGYDEPVRIHYTHIYKKRRPSHTEFQKKKSWWMFWERG